MNRSEAGKKGYEKTAPLLEKYLEEKSRATREKFEQDNPHCENCGTSLTFEQRRNRFCSHSCSASFSNQRRPSISKRSGVCSCGNTKKLTNKYCDECIQKKVYNRAGSLEDAKDARSRRRIILEERGHRCEVCGLSEWMGKPIPIELDHINGDADINTRDNLRLICPNCHAQTDTYKGANAGKGSKRQASRRKRYADGKTY